MRIISVSRSKEFLKALACIRDQSIRNRIKEKIKLLVEEIMRANSPLGIAKSLNKPSNTKPFRRANIHENLEMYWSLEDGVLLLADLGDHSLLKKYRDARKKAR